MRWMNRERGDRHILVNIPDFHAYVIDDEEVSFRNPGGCRGHRETRPSHTPEFSDTNGAYGHQPKLVCPALDRRGGISAGHDRVGPWCLGRASAIDAAAAVRSAAAAVDWEAYRRHGCPRSFPFDLRQPPGPGNALGRVKVHVPEPVEYLSARHAVAEPVWA